MMRAATLGIGAMMFMAMIGFIFDALAIWYVVYLCRPWLRRRT